MHLIFLYDCNVNAIVLVRLASPKPEQEALVEELSKTFQNVGKSLSVAPEQESHSVVNNGSTVTNNDENTIYVDGNNADSDANDANSVDTAIEIAPDKDVHAIIGNGDASNSVATATNGTG